jgi:hypothetical protein
MKNNLENAFKESLDQYEVSYDSKAWDAVDKQLDANAAAGSSVLSSALKWILASVLFGTVVTGSYFLWYNEDKAIVKRTAGFEDQEDTEAAINKEQEVEEKILVTENTEEVVEEKLKEQSNLVTPITSETKKIDQNKIAVREVKKEEIVQIQKSETVKEPKEIRFVPATELSNSNNYISGLISNPVVCVGELVEISNTSKNEIVRFKINEKWIVLKSNMSYDLAPNESVEINFVNDKNELIETKYITMNELPNPDFNFEANIYEEGMPVVIADAYGDYVTYSWDFGEEAEVKGAIGRHHFFDKGDYEITLNVVDRNGCEARASKIVRIRDKFNLMAVDAFKLNGSDVRNRTFMPYSLTERDVRFQLTIVDPIDNGVVFTSNNSADTWDGTDQRTGKLTSSNKSFIWKVQIFNPAPNERPIYAGTIVHN